MIRKKPSFYIGNLKGFKTEELGKSVRVKKRNPKLCVNPATNDPDPLNWEDHLLKDILWEDGPNGSFTKMTIDKFEELLEQVQLKIKTTVKSLRYALTPRIMLALTLRFFVNGQTYRSLESLTRIPHKTISIFVPKVIRIISDSMQYQYMKTPSTEEEWMEIENDFYTLYRFPHTLGAVDGKHIQMRTPSNFKSDSVDMDIVFSVSLFAVVDAHGRFIYVDVGGNGTVDDVDVMQNCSLYKALQHDELNIPPPSALNRQLIETPYYFIGDEIFDLGQHFMKTYGKSSNLTIPQKIFNSRLSNALSTAEIAFRKLVSRFLILNRPLTINPEQCIDLVRTCCVLHNYLSQNKETATDIDNEMDKQFNFPISVTPLPTQIHEIDENAYKMRERIADYCAADGFFIDETEEFEEDTMSEIL